MNSLIAGAMAGLVVDLSLFPIDTVKTRIQSKEGFLASGGFKNIYKGLSAVAVGSVPGGAAFFVAYDSVKHRLLDNSSSTISQNTTMPLSYRELACQGIAAMCGESFACCVRAPVEMAKQQMQAGHHSSIRSALVCITNNIHGEVATGCSARMKSINMWGVHYLFSGMPIMLMREMPFSIIQMSLYESLKNYLSRERSLQSYYYTLLPLCGAVSGGSAAFLTTPLDVVKTRIMLQQHRGHGIGAIACVVRGIITEPSRPGDRFGTTQKFFRGAATRVLWISLGGSIFFGTYELIKKAVTDTPCK